MGDAHCFFSSTSTEYEPPVRQLNSHFGVLRNLSWLYPFFHLAQSLDSSEPELIAWIFERGSFLSTASRGSQRGHPCDGFFNFMMLSFRTVVII
jgi:hypothetical protein